MSCFSFLKTEVGCGLLKLSTVESGRVELSASSWPVLQMTRLWLETGSASERLGLALFPVCWGLLRWPRPKASELSISRTLRGTGFGVLSSASQIESLFFLLIICVSSGGFIFAPFFSSLLVCRNSCIAALWALQLLRVCLALRFPSDAV